VRGLRDNGLVPRSRRGPRRSVAARAAHVGEDGRSASSDARRQGSRGERTVRAPQNAAPTPPCPYTKL
jgi:hypothetical protein